MIQTRIDQYIDSVTRGLGPPFPDSAMPYILAKSVELDPQCMRRLFNLIVVELARDLRQHNLQRSQLEHIALIHLAEWARKGDHGTSPFELWSDHESYGPCMNALGELDGRYGKELADYLREQIS